MHSQSRDPETPTRESKPEPGTSTGIGIGTDTGNGTGADTDKLKTIPIKVVDQAGMEITFKIKRSKPLQKVIDAYCNHKEIADQKIVRFTFDGERIQPGDTADSLEMDDEGRIDVFLEQQGGAK